MTSNSVRRATALAVAVAVAVPAGAQVPAGAKAPALQPSPAELVTTQQQLQVYSAFWPNLHNVLWAEAWAARPVKAGEQPIAGVLPERLPAAAAAEERKAWAAAVAYYDEEVADLHPLFDAESSTIRRTLLAAPADLPATGLAAAHRQVLVDAAPVYRKHLWTIHDRANREWITAALAKIASLSPAVPERLSALYGTPWFAAPLRLDVVRVSSREGAFTSMDPAPGHLTLSSSSPNGQDWAAVEIILHEASHLLFLPIVKIFGAELQAQGKLRKGPIETSNALVWHAALFYSTGEVVRRALQARGIAYEPYADKTGMFERAWPHFRAPIETHWKAFIDGRLPRDEAIKRIVAELK
jgi:hypothetical protein